VSRRPIVLPAGVYVATFRLLSRLYAGCGLALGLVLLLGGPTRFGSRSFDTLRAVPGGVGTWGAVGLVGGAVMLFGSWTARVRSVQTGAAVLVGWHAFFALTFTVAAIRTGTTSLTGCVTYAACAAWGGLMLSALREAGRSTPSGRGR
jgi:hypothetical protein